MTRAVNTAAGVIAAAMQQGRQTPAGLALALDSAQLLNSPEHAARVAELEARLAEYEKAADQVHPSVTSWQLEVLESGCWLGTGVRADSREAAEDLLRKHREAKPGIEWRVVSTTKTYTLLAELEAPPSEPRMPAVGDRYVKRAAPDAGRIVTVNRVWTADDGHTAVAYEWPDSRASYAGSACPLDVFHRTYAAETGGA